MKKPSIDFLYDIIDIDIITVLIYISAVLCTTNSKSKIIALKISLTIKIINNNNKKKV